MLLNYCTGRTCCKSIFWNLLETCSPEVAGIILSSKYWKPALCSNSLFSEHVGEGAGQNIFLQSLQQKKLELCHWLQNRVKLELRGGKTQRRLPHSSTQILCAWPFTYLSSHTAIKQVCVCVCVCVCCGRGRLGMDTRTLPICSTTELHP
jgi:hypothetical protein